MSDERYDGYTRISDILWPFSGLQAIDPVVLKNAADRGTRCHAACDALIKGLPYFDDDQTINGYVESFRKWSMGKEFLPHPGRFFCEELKITGECDMFYCNPEGKLVLVDLKTPANESKSWLLQGSAYSYLAKQNGWNVDIIEFVKLDKTGKDAKVFTYKEDFALFRKCFDVYNYFFKDKKPEFELDYL